MASLLYSRIFRALRGKSRFYGLAVATVFTLFYLYHDYGDQGSLESVQLAMLMNSNASSAASWPGKSSFDWSAVELRYPPDSQSPPPGTTAPATLPRIQHKFGFESSSAAKIRVSRRQEVKKVFEKCWASYKREAWLKDDLMPISGGHKDQFSGWAATLVDSLDTLWIMGLRKEFDEAVEAVAQIDFGESTNMMINIFETNIRYLGGLMAAYDLSGRKILLEKAIELGNLIYIGFNTKNGMPVDSINFDKAKTGEAQSVEQRVVSASPGTLSLEMTRLSQLTGDPKYFNAISKVMDVFYQSQNNSQLPGMWPMYVSMRHLDLTSETAFTLGGCADSLYEYLPKMHALLGGQEAKYVTMSKAFMETADKYLFFRPMLPDGDDILISGNVNVLDTADPSLDPESEHLACFVGGLFAMAGRLFKEERSVETGEKLTKGCVYAYRAFPSGIGPERFNMAACESRLDCQWNEEKWNEEKAKRPEWKEHLPKGFTTAKDPRYLLRPEAIESVFVLWRITGKEEYREAAWEMFMAVSNASATDIANAEVLDVTLSDKQLPLQNHMEVSLLFSIDEVIALQPLSRFCRSS